VRKRSEERELRILKRTLSTARMENKCARCASMRFALHDKARSCTLPKLMGIITYDSSATSLLRWVNKYLERNTVLYYGAFYLHKHNRN